MESWGNADILDLLQQLGVISALVGRLSRPWPFVWEGKRKARQSQARDQVRRHAPRNWMNNRQSVPNQRAIVKERLRA